MKGNCTINRQKTLKMKKINITSLCFYHSAHAQQCWKLSDPDFLENGVLKLLKDGWAWEWMLSLRICGSSWHGGQYHRKEQSTLLQTSWTFVEVCVVKEISESRLRILKGVDQLYIRICRKFRGWENACEFWHGLARRVEVQSMKGSGVNASIQSFGATRYMKFWNTGIPLENFHLP